MEMGRLNSILSALVAAGAALLAVPPPLFAFDVLEGASELQDGELAGIQGRYVNGKDVRLFGVQMQTHWQSPEGGHHQAQLHINFEFYQGQGTPPKVTILRSEPAPAAPPSANGQGRGSPPAHSAAAERRVDGSGIDNVNGVAQSVQVAGDGNSAFNNLSWRISDEPGKPALSENLVPLKHSTEHAHANANEAATRFRVKQDEIGYTLAIPGKGKVQQRIRGGDSPAKGIQQSIQLNSNMNEVINNMTLDVRLQSLPGPQRDNLMNALRSIQGMY